MRNLEILGNQCIEELNALNIDMAFLPDIKWQVSRGRRTLGKCRTDVRNNVATIFVSDMMLDENIIRDENHVKEVIIHELLHALRPEYGHGSEWKYLAECVNTRSNGKYQITRLANLQRYGISDDLYAENYKYKITCLDCGTATFRNRSSKIIHHPECYKCRCGGKLKVETLR